MWQPPKLLNQSRHFKVGAIAQVMPPKHTAEKNVVKAISVAIILKIYFHLPDNFVE